MKMENGKEKERELRRKGKGKCVLVVRINTSGRHKRLAEIRRLYPQVIIIQDVISSRHHRHHHHQHHQFIKEHRHFIYLFCLKSIQSVMKIVLVGDTL